MKRKCVHGEACAGRQGTRDAKETGFMPLGIDSNVAFVVSVRPAAVQPSVARVERD